MLAGLLALLAPGAAPAALIHHYTFDTDATDSVGSLHGTLMGSVGTATIVPDSISLTGVPGTISGSAAARDVFVVLRADGTGITLVPEPSAFILCLFGLGTLLCGFRRVRRKGKDRR